MKENPFMRAIHLVQHTPLIHFQRDKAGATLRATEVKAKLDKFLLENADDTDKVVLRKSLINAKNTPDHGLDYKMRIGILKKGAPGKRYHEIPNKKREERGKEYPMLFANIGNDYDDGDRVAVFDEELSLTIQSFKPGLLDIIGKHLADFFFCTNFGMRTTKGYGSFTVKDKATNLLPRFSFSVPTNDWRSALRYVDLFYKSVRGGLNGAPLPNGRFAHVGSIYMKPLIFLYANDNNVTWEKRIIKQEATNLFPLMKWNKDRGSWNMTDEDVNNQETYWKKRVDFVNLENWPLWQRKDHQYVVRDLLGLSTDQTWRGYGQDHNAAVKKVATKAHKEVERYPSPFIFKLINRNDYFEVNVFVEKIPVEYLKAEFDITVNRTPLAKPYQVWEQFDMDYFISEYFKLTKLQSAISLMKKSGYSLDLKDWEIDKRIEAAQKVKEILKAIYKQINPE